MPITGVNIQGVNRSIWALPETLDKDALIKDMGQAFVLEPAISELVRTTWFDTFDWRLYNRNQLLHYDGAAWNLIRRDSGKIVSVVADKPTGEAISSRDFLPGPFRILLESTLKMRCLLPLFTDALILAVYRVKNNDDKTVAVVVLEEHRFSGTDTVYRVFRLEGVRGYDNPYRKVRRFLGNYGIQETGDLHSFFDAGVRSQGRLPLDYSSRFFLSLQPEMSAFQAMTGICRQLLETMKRNEFGITGDLDTEFLHDFRVAVRRTRSGLGQIKQVLPAKVVEDYKNKFAWLGEITGSTRDLDVYLLYEDNYRSRLPVCLHAGLQPFFEEIRVRRAGEQKKLIRHLKSKKYRMIVSSWEKYLSDKDSDEAGENAKLAVMELSRNIIFRKYGKIIKAGKGIGPLSPDVDLHRLRIHCKKLRYILEFFASLYPVDEIRRIIKQLRRLQSNLGDFNDLSVQQEMLRQYLASVRPGLRRNQEMAASLGGLLTNLHHEHRRVRNDFAKRFQAFSRPENGALYRKLFASKR